MVISYIHSICWCMKSAFYERQQSASGALQGPVGVEVVGTGPRLGDDIGSLPWALVVHAIDASVSGSTTLGDAALPFRSPSAAGPRASRL
jgi:hypothetical protein